VHRGIGIWTSGLGSRVCAGTPLFGRVVTPAIPALRPHRAGHVAESEHDPRVGTPWPPEDGCALPDARQFAPDVTESRVFRLRRPLLRRERAADQRGGVEVALLHLGLGNKHDGLTTLVADFWVHFHYNSSGSLCGRREYLVRKNLF